MPFAMWFFLGIEELPLAAEEAHEPARDIPKAGIRGMATLVVTAMLVLVLNPGLTGAKELSESGEPLLDGFRAILPNSDVAALLAAFALVGLLASLQGIMFAYGRNIYSLSRAGYYPKMLSLTGSRKTPWTALIAGAVIGYAALLWAQYGGESAGAVVLNIAVWGAVIAYMLQMISYLLLKKRLPNLARPYKSPVGSMGAIVAGLLAALVFVGQALNPALTTAIQAIAIVYVIGLVGFGLFGRKKLVLSPEEEAAIKGHK
jgi:ethanolamine permease